MNDRLHHSLFTPPRATDLLQQYQPGATFFASPARTILASGLKAALPHCATEQLPASAAALLRQAGAEGEAQPLLIGALPFRLDAPARLFIPQRLSVGQGVDRAPSASIGERGAPRPASARLPNAIRMQPTPDAYRGNVERALLRIRQFGLEKVVLSRSLTLEVRLDLAALLRRLAARNLLGYTFAIDLADAPEPRRTLIGASPELLLARHGRQVVSHPLAGSIPRSADAQEDRRRADGLLRSGKDRHEHALVVDAVAAALRPFCRTLRVPAAPTLLATPTMWHLGTEVRGELADPAASALTLALALHPTPAVCGHPTAAARDFIAGVEGFDRRFFAGLAGWCDAAGDGEWAVTLRCAEVGEHGATLYAGAGIVAGSEPALELLETSAKLRTMLAAMDLEAVLEQAA